MSGSLTAANSQVHRALEQALERHRIEVMRCDLASARSSFASFADLLRRHIDDEETLIRPWHEAAGAEAPPPRGGSADIVDREHDKLRRHLEEVDRRLSALTEASSAASFLALLDRQKVLVDLLEHHDTRETDLVYPCVEAAMPADARERAADRLRAPLD